MEKRNIYVIGGSVHYTNWMMPTQIVDRMEDANLVVATGGEDWSPFYYNEPKNPTTYCNPQRDAFEWAEFEKAISLGKHLIGICRGSQGLCVRAGGKLVQDQDNHGSHYMYTSEGKIIPTTSTHHQAQYPWGLPKEEYKVLAWTIDQSKYHDGGNCEEMVNGVVEGNRELEVCFYPRIRALAIQGHPEFAINREDMKEFIEYSRKLLDDHLNNIL